MSHPRSALVTGSTSGIGLAIAHKLAASGVNVMLNGFGKPEETEAIRAEIEKNFGVKAAYNGADLTRAEEIESLIADTREKLGGLDILVNNAGIQHVSPIESFPVEKWDAILALNLSSAFHTIRLSFEAMKTQGFGRIINIASAHALVASPFKSAYVAAKHGLAGLTKTVALEGAEHGVTANAIAPGYVLTPLVEKQIPDTAKARGISEEDVIKTVILAGQPTHKFVEAENIGDLVVYLASDAAQSITGAVLSIDGGWTAQ